MPINETIGISAVIGLSIKTNIVKIITTANIEITSKNNLGTEVKK